MKNLVQKKDQSTSEYFHDKYSRCKLLELSLEEVNEQILAGLWSREPCNALLSKTHKDADDLLHHLLQQEQLSNERKDRIGSLKDAKGRKSTINLNMQPRTDHRRKHVIIEIRRKEKRRRRRRKATRQR